MRTGFILLAFLAAAPAIAQGGAKPLVKPVKPSVTMPTTPRPVMPTVPQVGPKPPAAKAVELAGLQKQLKDVEAEIASIEDAKRMRDRLKGQKDAIGEANKADLMHLQEAMEQKAQLEQMISDAQKAASKPATTLAKDLKAS